MFFVHKSAIGSKVHLLYDEETGKFEWSDTVSGKPWGIGIPTTLAYPKRVEDVATLMGAQLGQDIIDGKYTKMLDHLTKNTRSEFIWGTMVPKTSYDQCVKRHVERSVKIVGSFSETPYFEHFTQGEEVLCSLKPAKIDVDLLKRKISSESELAVLSSLMSLKPREGEDQTQKIVYNRTRSTTGRPTIVSGPKILTLPRRHRDVFRSRYQDGKIVSIDFVSLEPRVSQLLTGVESSRDIYEDFSLKLKLDLDRTEMKIAVISAMYGGSCISLYNKLSREKTLDVIKVIKNNLGVEKILDVLRSSLKSGEIARNLYGRPLRNLTEDSSDGDVVSHYVQSTAVDISLLGFRQILETLSSVCLTSIPLFVVHDAMFLDIDSESVETLQAVVDEGVNLGFGKLHLKMSGV